MTTTLDKLSPGLRHLMAATPQPMSPRELDVRAKILASPKLLASLEKQAYARVRVDLSEFHGADVRLVKELEGGAFAVQVLVTGSRIEASSGPLGIDYRRREVRELTTLNISR